MPATPELADLVDAVVVLRDAVGQGGRYVVDHVHGDTAICNDVFRGRQVMASRWTAGTELELGAPDDRGWLVATAHVEHATRAGSITLTVGELRVVQRRRAYREEIVVPFVLREHLADRGRRGRTDNLSAGGFAARIEGGPLDEGTEVLVTFSLPDHDELTVPCRKVTGDLPQRFEFVDLDNRTEERLARLVRATELARRRSAGVER